MRLEPDVPGEDWCLAFEVAGEPVPKGRARVTIRGDRVSAYTPASTLSAQDAVGWAAKEAGASLDAGEHDYRLDIVFRSAGWQRRDIDNLTKTVLDALTGVVWADDSQVRGLAATLDRGASSAGTYVIVRRLPPQRTPVVACEVCGKQSRRTDRLRWCSHACQKAASKARRMVACEVCGVPFVPALHNKRRTCSDDCKTRLAIRAHRRTNDVRRALRSG